MRLIAAACAAASMLVSAPSASADPFLVVNVTVVVSPTFNLPLYQTSYQMTNVSVTQINYGPNNSNGDVTVTVGVPRREIACISRCRGLGNRPGQSTKGQVR